MLVAVIAALLVGTFLAVSASFSRSPESGTAIAATAPPNEGISRARVTKAKDDAYMPMSRKTASLLLYSVLSSGGGKR